MKLPKLITLEFLPSLYSASVIAFQLDVQWSDGNRLTQDLRSFQPEAALWNKTGPPLQQSFQVDTDRTHNRVKKACKEITQPWTQVEDREDRDYLRRRGYVKAVRLTQTPYLSPDETARSPIEHPYPRSARGIAFFANNNCKGEPKFLLWPKQAFDMDYPTRRRYEILRSPVEAENFWFKWTQTFEFADFDIKRDPNSHYNLARPKWWQAMGPYDLGAIEKFMAKYPEDVYLKRGTLGSPMGSPFHQPFGSFREIFPTRTDRIWRQIVSPTPSDLSYWKIPMINVQLDHRNAIGQQRSNFWRSFVPYGLVDSSWATVFELIEQEYARFFGLMVDLLGTPGKSPIKRLRWSTKRQAAALSTLASVSDPEATNHNKVVERMERNPTEGSLSSLRSDQIYTTSPKVADNREWVLPPSWTEVPVWSPMRGRIVDGRPTGAFRKDPNPNRFLYSSVQIIWETPDKFKVQTIPVISNPFLAQEKAAADIQLPVIEEQAAEVPGLMDMEVVAPQKLEVRPIKVDTIADMAMEEEMQRVGNTIQSPLLSPAGSLGALSQPPLSLDVSEDGTAGSLSELAQSIMNQANGNSGNFNMEQMSDESMDVEPKDALKESFFVTRPRSKAVSGPRPQLQIESLSESRVSYRPQDDPLRESGRSRLSSGNQIESLQGSVVIYKPPPPQNLRENILKASQFPNSNGDVVVPIGEDLTESIVFNTKQRPGAKSIAPTTKAKTSGTGKKEACIPRPSDARLARGLCQSLICCSGSN